MSVGNEPDVILELLREKIANDESMHFVTDPEQMSMFELAYNVLKSVSRGGVVTYTIDDGFKGVCDVSIIGKKISFDDTEALIFVSKIASNVNVYSRLDGSVRMDFTFYGTSRPLRR